MSLALLLVLLALLVTYVATAANRFTRQRHLVRESWAQIEVELRRRQDLVPALVGAVRAHEAHESALLREVLAARDQAVRASGPGEVDPAEERLTRALSALSVRAAASALPQPGPAQQLQAQLAETEDRIAAARRLHAANVRALDVRLHSFPGSLVARALGVERLDDAELVSLSDRERAELEVPPDR